MIEARSAIDAEAGQHVREARVDLTQTALQIRADERGQPIPCTEFPDLRIAPPVGDNRNHALVVDGPLPLAEAQALRARNYGFRDDTFLWPARRAYFKATWPQAFYCRSQESM
ncbi:hypothetical protein [Alkalilimnicola ehrlichii]